MNLHLKNLISYIVLLFLNIAFSQDTIVSPLTIKKEPLKFKQLIVPSSILVTGLLLKEQRPQRNLQKNFRRMFGYGFDVRVDDYAQYAPLGQMILGKYFGYNSKNNLKQMITNSLISNLIGGAIVKTSKGIFSDLRPDGSRFNSFPSGHTTTGFNNATLLFLEYKDDNLWYASSGYIFAATTAIFRIANNVHWTGDVVVGMGIGIGVATIVHHWNPIIFKDKKAAILGYPLIDAKNYGIGILYQIK